MLLNSYACPECQFEVKEIDLPKILGDPIELIDISTGETIERKPHPFQTIKDLCWRKCENCKQVVEYQLKKNMDGGNMGDLDDLLSLEKQMMEELPYIRLVEGNSTTLVAKTYLKVENKKTAAGKVFEFKSGTQGLGYCFVLKDSRDKELTVTSWGLHKALMEAFKSAGKIDGVKITIHYPKRGEYMVAVVK